MSNTEKKLEPYNSLREEASAVFVEKKSEFIGYAAPVSTEDEAIAFIEKIRKKHADARHNVYAYLLKNGTTRYSDAGEPQGTAGIPTLEVIRKGGFCDAVIVVTRYFGGILLGAGGLVRAYTAAAKMAAEAAGIVTYTERTVFTLDCSYTDYQRLLPQLKRYDITVDDTVFADSVKLFLSAETEGFTEFSDAIREITAGKLLPENIKKTFGGGG